MDAYIDVLCKLTTCNNKAKHTCRGCRKARYCSKDCQIKHWNHHKSYCIMDAKDANKTPNKKQTRLILLTDENYRHTYMQLQTNEPQYIGDRKNERTEIIMRIDGNMYEKESGIRIVSQSMVSKNAKDNGIHVTTNWGKLLLTYGDPIYLDETYSVFLSKPKRIIYILDRINDTTLGEIPFTIDTDNFDIKVGFDKSTGFYMHIIKHPTYTIGKKGKERRK